MKALILALALTAPVLALASPPKPLPTPGNPPQVSQPATYTFADWKAVWERSLRTNEALLLGSWKIIGLSTNCSGLGKNMYDLNGYTNKDGSVLNFSFALTPNAKGENVLAVFLQNMGRKNLNQGPYEVDPNEPQFSQWQYDGNTGEQAKDLWTEYSCRQSAEQANQMVCLVSLKGEGSKYNDDTKACLKKDYSNAFVLEKL